MSKINVVQEFLNQWKEQAFAFYCNNKDLYNSLRQNYKEELNKYKETATLKYGHRNIEEQFNCEYYKEIELTTKEILQYGAKDFEKNLNISLEKEMERKYKKFITRVNKKVGNVIDAQNLKVSSNGELNGIIIGENGTCTISTILAGGYNVQCLHYRVVIN